MTRHRRLINVPSVHSAEVFDKVLFTRKTPADWAAFAVAVRAQTRCFRAAVLVVDFPFMPVETPWISKALYFLAADFFADVGSKMLVHVLSSILVSTTLTHLTIWDLNWESTQLEIGELTYIRTSSRKPGVLSNSQHVHSGVNHPPFSQLPCCPCDSYLDFLCCLLMPGSLERLGWE